jgi:hypothetical protein
LVLAADSVAMAEHAASLSLVSPETVSEVRNERMATDPSEPESHTYGIQRSTPTRTAEAVAQGDLQDLVESGSEPMPPNLIVESQAREQPKNPDGM